MNTKNRVGHAYPVGTKVQVLDQRSRKWVNGTVTGRCIEEGDDWTDVTWTVDAPTLIKGPKWIHNDPTEIRTPR